LAKKDFEEWRFYGRRSGRKLTSVRQNILDTLLPDIGIPEDEITKDGSLAPSSLLKIKPDRLVLEIGFGNGERLAEAIKQNPSTGFIGAEPFVNGMSSFLCDIKAQDTLKNVCAYMDNAIPLVKSFMDKSFDEIYILNPDPWHKTRHHNRRIVNQKNLDHFARILKSKGKLIMSTDVEPLAEWMVTEAMKHPAFKWTAKCANDWRQPPSGWISTRYETKRAKGAGKMNYLVFERN
jgi:tRNA (guanine-N7-)-methyltransferase